jgi:hypothetical protein
MVESVLATVIVGVMMVAAVQTVAASRMIQFKSAERAQGVLLAGELITEVLARAYEDASSPVFGPEAGETGRAQFDDADDYHNWQEQPPQQPDGTPVVGLDQWRREVVIERVPPLNLALLSAVDTGARRVTVTVRHRGVPIVRLYAVRTSAR